MTLKKMESFNSMHRMNMMSGLQQLQKNSCPIIADSTQTLVYADNVSIVNVIKDLEESKSLDENEKTQLLDLAAEYNKSRFFFVKKVTKTLKRPNLFSIVKLLGKYLILGGCACSLYHSLHPSFIQPPVPKPEVVLT